MAQEENHQNRVRKRTIGTGSGREPPVSGLERYQIQKGNTGKK